MERHFIALKKTTEYKFCKWNDCKVNFLISF